MVDTGCHGRRLSIVASEFYNSKARVMAGNFRSFRDCVINAAIINKQDFIVQAERLNGGHNFFVE